MGMVWPLPSGPLWCYNEDFRSHTPWLWAWKGRGQVKCTSLDIFDIVRCRILFLQPTRQGTTLKVTTSRWSAVRPAVQSLQIQEVRTWPLFIARFTSCLHPVFSTGSISAILHLYDSKQRPTERTTLLLSIRSWFISRGCPRAPW